MIEWEFHSTEIFLLKVILAVGLKKFLLLVKLKILFPGLMLLLV